METSAFLEFIRLVVSGDTEEVSRRLQTFPALATQALPVRDTSTKSYDTFFPDIRHYLSGGDTALHMAAAAYSCPLAKLMIGAGASCHAKNRRGAVPLHYASDGRGCGSQTQANMIKYLLSVGADPNVVDKSGVAPLHRAVRTRSLPAVHALLDGGADLRQPNQSGSTPLHLAVQTTGASGSGSDNAREQQERIIRHLVNRGARPSDQDSKGKTVMQAAKSLWIRSLLTDIKTD